MISTIAKSELPQRSKRGFRLANFRARELFFRVEGLHLPINAENGVSYTHLGDYLEAIQNGKIPDLPRPPRGLFELKVLDEEQSIVRLTYIDGETTTDAMIAFVQSLAI